VCVWKLKGNIEEGEEGEKGEGCVRVCMCESVSVWEAEERRATAPREEETWWGGVGDGAPTRCFIAGKRGWYPEDGSPREVGRYPTAESPTEVGRYPTGESPREVGRYPSAESPTEVG
jgi:hypothetical protein